MDFKAGEIFAIDKPYRISSFGALAHVRYVLSRTLGYKVKIGHAGTLDPLATGVLILCTGKATKRIEEFQGQTKEYTATLQLGATTRALIDEKLQQFIGDIAQVPPTFSAVKVNGDRAYELRRAGEDVKLSPKQIHIDEIEVTDFDAGKMLLSIRVVCGKGTYIRALARDLGRALDSGAYLTSLRRTRVGEFTIEKCLDYEHIREWIE